MPWNANYNKTSRIIELEYTGVTTAQDLQEATTHCIALGKAKDVKKYLVNAIDMELSATMMDIYNIPTKQYVDEEADQTASLAVIAPQSARGIQAVKIYEIVCRSNGWKVKVFENGEGALDWLDSSPSSSELLVE